MAERKKIYNNFKISCVTLVYSSRLYFFFAKDYHSEEKEKL